jgi:predicted Zn-dependent protease
LWWTVNLAKRDPLFRDTVVYLTCLHESGHALGLPHTAQFADIMYSFGFGGDIVEYFGRYRRELSSRQRIQDHSGISPADREKLAALLKK